MAMQWNENLAVGVDVIDNQHKGIISRINNLLNAMSQGKGKDEVGKGADIFSRLCSKTFQC